MSSHTGSGTHLDGLRPLDGVQGEVWGPLLVALVVTCRERTEHLTMRDGDIEGLVRSQQGSTVAPMSRIVHPALAGLLVLGGRVG